MDCETGRGVPALLEDGWGAVKYEEVGLEVEEGGFDGDGCGGWTYPSGGSALGVKKSALGSTAYDESR